MLHAVAKGKTKFYKRYLNRREREPHEAMVRAEDEITSIIIGPMDFMLPNEIHRFWMELFSLNSNRVIFPELPPERVNFRR